MTDDRNGFPDDAENPDPPTPPFPRPTPQGSGPQQAPPPQPQPQPPTVSQQPAAGQPPTDPPPTEPPVGPGPGPGPTVPPPARVAPPEPPWFAIPDPGPPRGSPEAPPWAPLDTQGTASWSAGLEQIAVAGTRQRTRSGVRRRIALIGAAVVVVAGIAAGAVVFLTQNGSDGDATAVATGPQIPFCETGTNGATTTTSTGADPTTPAGAVAAFLSAAIDDRSAAAARATMTVSAPVPTVGDLQTWIGALPASTDAWCARITTTDSAARLLVDVRVRTPEAVADVARNDTFYVSASGPDRWSIDAIVSGTTLSQ